MDLRTQHTHANINKSKNDPGCDFEFSLFNIQTSLEIAPGRSFTHGVNGFN